MNAISTSKKQALSFNQYRAAFAEKDSSISKWAQANDYSPQYIYDVLKGNRSGKAADEIRATIKAHLQLT